jgi:hypothetical protein
MCDVIDELPKDIRRLWPDVRPEHQHS